MIMFDQVFESLRKATEATVEAQQELFKKWISLWPATPSYPLAGGDVQLFQKRWAEAVQEQLRRQRQIAETQFKTGLQNIEKAFQLGQARTADELRARTRELWQQCFESLRQAYEAQLGEFQAAMTKWIELTSRVPA
jgi:hypothetical protein